jgi:hypothetical protein
LPGPNAAVAALAGLHQARGAVGSLDDVTNLIHKDLAQRGRRLERALREAGPPPSPSPKEGGDSSAAVESCEDETDYMGKSHRVVREASDEIQRAEFRRSMPASRVATPFRTVRFDDKPDVVDGSLPAPNDSSHRPSSRPGSTRPGSALKRPGNRPGSSVKRPAAVNALAADTGDLSVQLAAHNRPKSDNRDGLAELCRDGSIDVPAYLLASTMNGNETLTHTAKSDILSLSSAGGVPVEVSAHISSDDDSANVGSQPSSSAPLRFQATGGSLGATGCSIPFGATSRSELGLDLDLELDDAQPLSPVARPVSPSIMSIHDALSPRSSGGDSDGEEITPPVSPSILVVDDEPRPSFKRLPADVSKPMPPVKLETLWEVPASPGKSKAGRGRPVRLLMPQPLSARGESRIKEEIQQGRGCFSARGPGPSQSIWCDQGAAKVPQTARGNGAGGEGARPCGTVGGA